MLFIRYYIITGFLFYFLMNPGFAYLPREEQIQKSCLDYFEELSHDNRIGFIERLLKIIIESEEIDENIFRKRNSALANFRKSKLKHSREGM